MQEVGMTTVRTGDHSEPAVGRLRSREAVVGVIGLGYVGLPLAAAAAEAGFPTIGFDLEASRARKVNGARTSVAGVDRERLRAVVENGNGNKPACELAPLIPARGRLRATTDLSLLARVDVAVVCVPTPLTRNRDPDLAPLTAASDAVAAGWHPGLLVVVESTSFPGTPEEIVLPRLEAAGRERRDGRRRRLAAGEDFFLAFSPERIDPGRRDWTLRNTPKVIGGMTTRCLLVACAFYETIVDQVVPVSCPRTAEMVKILENTFRAVNVGLINEMAVICHELGIDVWEVIEAAKTKPFGFTPFYPGPGLGGHCIPIDPLYLAWRLRSRRLPARSIQLADELNGVMPEYVVGRIADLLDERGVTLHGSRVLLLGVAYKSDVGDTRESPAIEVFERLERHGARVSFHDPFVSHLGVGGVTRARVGLSPEQIESFDCVVVLTNHSQYDWALIAEHARLLFDTRNATAGIAGREVVRL
jgi:UDP-N-acetyl-D-glucosamine dehydrogenase